MFWVCSIAAESMLDAMNFYNEAVKFENMGRNSIEGTSYRNAVALSDIVLQIERGVRLK